MHPLFPSRLTEERSSWPGLSRPSTSFLPGARQDVDVRHRAGHDEQGSGAHSCSSVRVDGSKLLCQIEHPLPVLSGFNPEENLNQFQTLENYGRTRRARPGRAQYYDVWREAASLAFHVSLRAQRGDAAFTLNHSTIVRGLIGRRMLVFVYEGTRNSCTRTYGNFGSPRTLAGGACRRCRHRPDLCQPARTRTGGPEASRYSKNWRARSPQISKSFSEHRARERHRRSR